MASKLSLLLLLLVLITYGSCSDLITHLPGVGTMPSFRQYSGYLEASDTKRFHYWFVESQSKPSSDPLVLWLNGGPGCSSLDGLLSENGPLLINNDGETLSMNPYSWNKRTNVIYMESPAGVGYSYDTTNKLKTNDDEVAQNNYNALVDFIKKYPQFADNEFYITGESYAGVYLPTLALKIFKGKQFNFKGMAVGNGLSNEEMNTESVVFFAYYHGLFGAKLWNKLSQYCCMNNVTADTCQFPRLSSGKCVDAVNEVLHTVYNSGLNFYALYRDCYGGDEQQGTNRRYAFDMNMLFTYKNQSNHLKHLLKTLPRRKQGTKLRFESNTHGYTNIPDCINSTASTNYLNKEEVRSALHIPSHLPDWEVCNTEVNEGYGRKYGDMAKVYQKLMSRDNFRILVYNGDTDMACNFLGDEWFVDKLKLQERKSRAPWYVNGQVAGFDKLFQSPTHSSTLHFTTIRGAGHMVPQWAPVKAYNMFMSFIMNEDFIR